MNSSTLSQHRYIIPLFLLIGSAGPLLLALISQYGFALHPCEMCIWQRIPFIAICVLALLSFFPQLAHPKLLLAAALIWTINALIATYHSAVEFGWVQSATGCTTRMPDNQSIEVLRDAILNSPLVSCSEPAFMFLGLSMANWNVLSCLFLALCALYLYKQIKPLK